MSIKHILISTTEPKSVFLELLFKCFNSNVLKSIDLTRINSEGYSFQIEMSFKTWINGFKIKEIPIIFTDRVKGNSKMNKSIIPEAIFGILKMKFKSVFFRYK